MLLRAEQDEETGNDQKKCNRAAGEKRGPMRTLGCFAFGGACRGGFFRLRRGIGLRGVSVPDRRFALPGIVRCRGFRPVVRLVPIRNARGGKLEQGEGDAVPEGLRCAGVAPGKEHGAHFVDDAGLQEAALGLFIAAGRENRSVKGPGRDGYVRADGEGAVSGRQRGIRQDDVAGVVAADGPRSFLEDDFSPEMDAGKNSESGGGHHFFSEPPVVRAS